MLTLKQAFSTAAALQSAKTQIKLCEACPMHSLHKLCERIEGTAEHGFGTGGVWFGVWLWESPHCHWIGHCVYVKQELQESFLMPGQMWACCQSLRGAWHTLFFFLKADSRKGLIFPTVLKTAVCTVGTDQIFVEWMKKGKIITDCLLFAFVPSPLVMCSFSKSWEL